MLEVWCGQLKNFLPGDFFFAEDAESALAVLDHNTEVIFFCRSSFQELKLIRRKHHHCKPFREKPSKSANSQPSLGIQEVTKILEKQLGIWNRLSQVIILRAKKIITLGGREVRDKLGKLDCYCFHHVRSLEDCCGQGNRRV